MVVRQTRQAASDPLEIRRHGDGWRRLPRVIGLECLDVVRIKLSSGDRSEFCRYGCVAVSDAEPVSLVAPGPQRAFPSNAKADVPRGKGGVSRGAIRNSGTSEDAPTGRVPQSRGGAVGRHVLVEPIADRVRARQRLELRCSICRRIGIGRRDGHELDVEHIGVFVESSDVLLAWQIEEFRVESNLPHDDGAGGKQTPQIHELGGSFLRVDQGHAEGSPLLWRDGADGKCRKRKLRNVQRIHTEGLIEKLVAAVASGENEPVGDGDQS